MRSPVEEVGDLIRSIVAMIVDKPNEISVTHVENNGRAIYTVKTAPDDAGKLIGRSGRIIQSMRAIVKAAAFTRGIRPDVEVVDFRKPWPPK